MIASIMKTVLSIVVLIAFSIPIGRVTCNERSSTNGTWVKLGSDIDGRDLSGNTLAMSADGTTVAIGSVSNDGGGVGRDAGYTGVYKWTVKNASLNLREWKQLGPDLNGASVADRFSHALALSADGTMMVVGASGSRYETNNGYVRVLKFDRTTKQWNAIGSDFEIDSSGADYTGVDVAMSANGSMVAIGTPGKAGTLPKFRVYHLNVATVRWEQMGLDIDGDPSYDWYLGRSIDMTADGTTIVVRAPSGGYGQVRVYKYSFSTKRWGQIGLALNGGKQDPLNDTEVLLEHFGHIVAISADGTTIAVTSTSGTEFDLHVQVFKYAKSLNAWEQKADDILALGFFGYAMSMSADGTSIAVGYGGFQIDNTCSHPGHVLVFTYASNSWKQVGANITGDCGDVSGFSVAMSSDGRRVAVGAPNAGDDSGAVRVYEFQPTTVAPTNNNCTISWNLYNSRSDALIAPLVNGSVITNPPPCNRTNIEAVVSCDNNNNNNNGTVIIELYNGNGTQLIHRRTERFVKYFLFGNNGNNVYHGRITTGTYMIRAILVVNGNGGTVTTTSPFTKFTLGGTCV